MSEQSDFGEVAEQFSEHYDEVRGHIREQVTRHNLDKNIRLSSAKPKLRIADVGGGDGRDAAWAAGFGHKVVLLEPSPAELKKAYAREDQTTFDIVPANAEQAFNMYSMSPFDLVLSHGVLMYQNNPEKHIRHLAGLIRPLGSLSLLTAGLYGKQARYGAKPDLNNLASLEASGKYTGNLGQEVTAYIPKEIADLLKKTGFNVLNWFGVRIFSDDDHRKIDSLEPKELDAILVQEVRLSALESCRGMGQMLHFIARKK